MKMKKSLWAHNHTVLDDYHPVFVLADARTRRLKLALLMEWTPAVAFWHVPAEQVEVECCLTTVTALSCTP